MDIINEIGTRLLFIGLDVCSDSNPPILDEAKIDNYAREARSAGFDSILLKVADGGIRWYRSLQELVDRKARINALGCGLAYYTYEYGPLFGAKQIYAEGAIACEIADQFGLLIVDAEEEFNSQEWAAADWIQSHQGRNILLTTWANPQEQGWIGVIEALRDHVAFWLPQVYYAHQVNTVHVYTDMNLPTIPIYAPDTGPTANLGYPAVGYWHAGQLNQGSIDRLGRPVSPDPTPVIPSTGEPYVIEPGDTLSGICARRGHDFWRTREKNLAHLDQTAQRYGYPNSENGNLIFPGDSIWLC